MSLFDFLKIKKEVEKSLSTQKGKKPYSESSIQTGRRDGIANRPTEKKVEKVSGIKKTKAAQENQVVKHPTFNIAQGKKEVNFSYDIVKEPHISEKATNLADSNRYTFKVYNNANKLEIKKSVEGIYKVNVLSVNTIKIPSKKRRLGKTEGFKKGYRKAIVKIREGQKIEIL